MEENVKSAERTPVNIVSSFFYYMWNKWSKKECEIVFANAFWPHLWSKWELCAERGTIFGAAERFYAELDEGNRDALVSRAIKLYNGRNENF